jgi:hypothetical protein
MSEDRRNPYLILGINYGSTPEEARAAFARCVRRLRQASSAPFTREDLTWALHEVEHPSEDPDRSVRYFRVPANRARPPTAEPGDLFFPIPELLPRRTPQTKVDDIVALADEAYRLVVLEILAAARARRCADPYANRAETGRTQQ